MVLSDRLFQMQGMAFLRSNTYPVFLKESFSVQNYMNYLVFKTLYVLNYTNKARC